VAAGERDAEQDETADGEGDCGPLAAGERDASRARGHDGEDADAAGRGRLHERERGERQREHVEPPAGRLRRKAGEPAAEAVPRRAAGGS
jgi:hypothetical protein